MKNGCTKKKLDKRVYCVEAIDHRKKIRKKCNCIMQISIPPQSHVLLYSSLKLQAIIIVSLL